MKLQLAMKVLADLMSWDDERLTAELPWLRLMVNYKYDHYHGYGPGVRFCVNLIYWLSQFNTKEERETAFKFVRTKLIYISSREMLHLVGLSMAEIRRSMRRSVAQSMNIPVHKTWGNKDCAVRLNQMHMRTLYVALSDGAKIDSFRRFNEGAVSNEQIVASPEISEKKWRGLIKDLRKRLDENGWEDVSAQFERICLIDDFTASGSTLIREDTNATDNAKYCEQKFPDDFVPISPDCIKLSRVWSGKIPRFCEQKFPDDFTPLTSGCIIHAHHYIATEKARQTVSDAVALFASQQKISIELTFSTVFEKSIVLTDGDEDTNLVALIKKCYDKGIEDKHTGKDIWFGYKQCGLPLVLDHNTPNNSVALIWAETDPKNQQGVKMSPLFPRIKRHSEHGQSI